MNAGHARMKHPVMNIIGGVEGRTCVLVDDLVDTAGTLCLAAMALKREGAVRVVSYCTHPVLSGSAVENIEASELDELVVTDTIPLRENAQDLQQDQTVEYCDHACRNHASYQ